VAAAPLRLVQSIDRELGTAGGITGQGGWMWDESEEIAAWQWPRSVQTCDQMRPDSQVSAVMRAVIWPLLNAQWHLDATGCRDEVAQHVSEDMDLPLLGQERPRPVRTKGRFSWIAHVADALLMLWYGHMPFEQVYQIEERNGREYARLRKLAPRMPLTISKINVADDGGLVSIEQYRRGSLSGAVIGDPIVIPIDRLVWYVHGKEGALWQGRSLLRSAYGDWLLKDRLKRVNAMTIERNGMGIPVVEAGPGSISTDVDRAQELASRARAGESAGVGMPNGMKLTFKGVEGTLPDAIPSMRYHDEAIARSLLVQFLQLGQTHTGSRSVGQTFMDFFKLFEASIGKLIADTATQHIAEDIVDLNWGEEEPAPRVVVSQIDVDAMASAEDLARLLDAGALRPDDKLEGHLRERFQLPAMDVATRHDVPSAGSSGDGATAVAASARPRSPRSRRVSAAADDAPTDPTALPEPLGTLYQRRIDLEQAQNDILATALTALAAAADLEAIADAAGVVKADTTQPLDPPALAASTEVLTAAAASSGLRDTAHDALVDSYAEGQAGAAQLTSVIGGQVGVDLEQWTLDFDTAVEAARNLDTLWADADVWVADHIGVTSRALSDAVETALEGGASRAELIADLQAVIENADTAAVLYDHALATAVDRGAIDLYKADGLEQVDVLTAGDARVDSVCQQLEHDNPYPVTQPPGLPGHVGCRCANIPADPAIRKLLNG
jgi:hypothetical protein